MPSYRIKTLQRNYLYRWQKMVAGRKLGSRVTRGPSLEPPRLIIEPGSVSPWAWPSKRRVWIRTKCSGSIDFGPRRNRWAYVLKEIGEGLQQPPFSGDIQRQNLRTDQTGKSECFCGFRHVHSNGRVPAGTYQMSILFQLKGPNLAR